MVVALGSKRGIVFGVMRSNGGYWAIEKWPLRFWLSHYRFRYTHDQHCRGGDSGCIIAAALPGQGMFLDIIGNLRAGEGEGVASRIYPCHFSFLIAKSLYRI